MLEELGVALDDRGNVRAAETEAYQTSVKQDLHRRRHAARPVPGGLGDP
jgi:hypothetical protein